MWDTVSQCLNAEGKTLQTIASAAWESGSSPRTPASCPSGCSPCGDEIQLIPVVATGASKALSKAGMCSSDGSCTQQGLNSAAACNYSFPGNRNKMEMSQFYWGEKTSHQLRCLKWEKLVLYFGRCLYPILRVKPVSLHCMCAGSEDWGKLLIFCAARTKFFRGHACEHKHSSCSPRGNETRNVCRAVLGLAVLRHTPQVPSLETWRFSRGCIQPVLWEAPAHHSLSM